MRTAILLPEYPAVASHDNQGKKITQFSSARGDTRQFCRGHAQPEGGRS